VERTNLDGIAQRLTDARDALIAYWEQSDGQVCLLALRLAEDALADYRALRDQETHGCTPADVSRIAALADEVRRLRAPLTDMR